MTALISHLKHFFALGLVALTFISCVSSHEVKEDYQKQLPVQFKPNPKRTILVILVDGLGATLLNENFDHIPTIQKYFAISSESFPIAHSVFPSLTFPNLMSLLTLTPVSVHSVVGNKMLIKNVKPNGHKHFDFETHEDLIWLNGIKESSMIYHQLSDKGRLSASFAQSLFAGSSAFHNGDLPMGAAYLSHDFYSIDQRNLKALEILLRDTSPNEWPDFIFLHLIGVDGLAHDFGPSSEKIGPYLEKLDQGLKNIFSYLQSAESVGHSIATILTADHGFMDVKRYSDLGQSVESKLEDADIINEGRILSFYFGEPNEVDRAKGFLSSLAQRKDIDLVAYEDKQTISIHTKHQRWIFPFHANLTCFPYSISVSLQGRDFCPDEIEKALGRFDLPPFAFENLISFFGSPQHPEAVIIAAEGVSFHKKYKGHHGGLSQQETLVPLLVKNIQIRNQRIPALFELLKVAFQ